MTTYNKENRLSSWPKPASKTPPLMILVLTPSSKCISLLFFNLKCANFIPTVEPLQCLFFLTAHLQMNASFYCHSNPNLYITSLVISHHSAINCYKSLCNTYPCPLIPLTILCCFMAHSGIKHTIKCAYIFGM